MEATRGEYTLKEGASLKTQNNGKKRKKSTMQNGKNAAESWGVHSQERS